MAKQLRSQVRLDNVKSVYTGHNYSIRLTQEMENGYVVKLGDIETTPENRDVRAMVVPAAEDKLVLIANPALIYDNNNRLDGLEKYYYMEENEIVRGYEIQETDIFSVTALGFDGTPVVGQYVVAGAGVKLVPSATAVDTGFCAKVVRIDKVGGALALNFPQSASEYYVLNVLSNGSK